MNEHAMSRHGMGGGRYARRFVRLIGLGMALLVHAGATWAAFHLWQLSEIHSNASGSVQYIVLESATGGQEFVNGHQITATRGSSTNTFTFNQDLPGDSAGKSFLIGTQGFAARGLVTPDFIVPDGFLFMPDGSLNFAGVDSWAYSALPSDGVYALDRSGNKIIARPRNFAGAATTVADCLFNWAERTYPQYFPAQAASQVLAPYFYRHYAATGNYLAVSATDSHVWVLGPVSGGALLDVGPIGSYVGLAGCA